MFTWGPFAVPAWAPLVRRSAPGDRREWLGVPVHARSPRGMVRQRHAHRGQPDLPSSSLGLGPDGPLRHVYPDFPPGAEGLGHSRCAGSDCRQRSALPRGLRQAPRRVRAMARAEAKPPQARLAGLPRRPRRARRGGARPRDEVRRVLLFRDWTGPSAERRSGASRTLQLRSPARKATPPTWTLSGES